MHENMSVGLIHLFLKQGAVLKGHLRHAESGMTVTINADRESFYGPAVTFFDCSTEAVESLIGSLQAELDRLKKGGKA